MQSLELPGAALVQGRWSSHGLARLPALPAQGTGGARTFLPLEAFSWTRQRLPVCPSPTSRVLASPPSCLPQTHMQLHASSLLPEPPTHRGSARDNPHLVLSKGSSVLPPAGLGRGPCPPLLWLSFPLLPGVIPQWDETPAHREFQISQACVSPTSGVSLQSSPVQPVEGRLTKLGRRRRNPESEVELTERQRLSPKTRAYPCPPPKSFGSRSQVRTWHGPCPRVL